MFYLTSGYITIRTFSVVKNIIAKVIAAVFFLAIFASILSYAYFSTESYYGKLKTRLLPNPCTPLSPSSSL